MAQQTTPAVNDIRQRIEDLLVREDLIPLQAYLTEQHPADIADALELLDDEKRVVIFNLLGIYLHYYQEQITHYPGMKQTRVFALRMMRWIIIGLAFRDYG